MLVDGKSGTILWSWTHLLQNDQSQHKDGDVKWGIVTDLKNSYITNVVFTKMYMISTHVVKWSVEEQEHDWVWDVVKWNGGGRQYLVYWIYDSEVD